jgi:hypothetical protein
MLFCLLPKPPIDFFFNKKKDRVKKNIKKTVQRINNILKIILHSLLFSASYKEELQKKQSPKGSVDNKLIARPVGKVAFHA